jgi:hypothetical protein
MHSCKHHQPSGDNVSFWKPQSLCWKLRGGGNEERKHFLQLKRAVYTKNMSYSLEYPILVSLLAMGGARAPGVAWTLCNKLLEMPSKSFIPIQHIWWSPGTTEKPDGLSTSVISITVCFLAHWSSNSRNLCTMENMTVFLLTYALTDWKYMCCRRNANLPCLLEQLEGDASVNALFLAANLLETSQGLQPWCPFLPSQLFYFLSLLNSDFLKLKLLSLEKEIHLVVHGGWSVFKLVKIKKCGVDGAIHATLFLSNEKKSAKTNESKRR